MRTQSGRRSPELPKRIIPSSITFPQTTSDLGERRDGTSQVRLALAVLLALALVLSSLLLPKLPRNSTGSLAIASLFGLLPDAPATLSSRQAEGN